MMAKKECLVYIDGEYLLKNEAKISVFDHGFLYGDGVFEGIRSYNGRVFKLDEHIDRLYESAKSIGLKIPLSQDDMKQKILETMRKNELKKDAYIRVVVTRGEGDLGLDPRKCPKPSIIIIADQIAIYQAESLRAITASTRRNAVTALNPMIKSLNYLNNILAKMEANRANVEEAIMLNQQGLVCEGSSDNLFIIKDRVIMTPPPSADILVGITRNTVIELAKKAGYATKEKAITMHDLYNADEAFFTGTAAQVMPLVEVDGRKMGNGKPGLITNELLTKFEEIRESGTPVY
jgi:branched-chain amino acid aminotransferase